MMTILGSSVNLLFCISRLRDLLKTNRSLRNSRKIAAKRNSKSAQKSDTKIGVRVKCEIQAESNAQLVKNLLLWQQLQLSSVR